MAINTNTRHNTWKMQMHIKHALEVWQKMPNKLNIKIWKKTKKKDGKKKKKETHAEVCCMLRKTTRTFFKLLAVESNTAGMPKKRKTLF